MVLYYRLEKPDWRNRMVKVVLVDDEEHALGMLSILLHEVGDVVVVGTYTNPLCQV